jgi:Cell Wall Hydrolase
MSVDLSRPIAIATIAAEARDQTYAAQVGVAATLFNRLSDGRFDKTIQADCTHRKWFSEWNADQVNNANLLEVMRMPMDHPVLLSAANAYDEAAAGKDPTGGATHFYSVRIAKPYWAVPPAVLTTLIDEVQFVKNVP